MPPGRYFREHIIARRGHPVPDADVTHGRRLRFGFGALSPAEAAAMLEGLTEVDRVQLSEGIPPISQALHFRRLRYRKDLPMSHWKTLREIWELGGGTCADFSAAVAAELRHFHGVQARPVIYHSRVGMWHAVVALPDGRVIDPSRTGGMGEREPLPASPALLAALGLPVPDVAGWPGVTRDGLEAGAVTRSRPWWAS